jgi:endosialidase-like protein
MDQLERPQYYEGEYLSADDLAAIVRYARTAQARHALGAHTWGIALGLDLVERPLTGDDVEMMLTPGVAWDGYARPLVTLAPQRLALDLFADLQDATTASGVPVEIWLTYRELPASPPGVGFSCPEDELHSRIVESYRLEVRPSPVADHHAVTIASRSIEATKALSTFDSSRKPLFDESVPSQTFPDTDRQRWPVFIGVVRWRKDLGQPGRLIKRIDADRNASRAGRRYLGVVAETVFAADGVLRLRDRSNDPADPAVNFKPPVVSPPPGTTPVNDLVWCEGHLRVVGDTRLQGGLLDYRVAGGGDGGVPILLRRTTNAGPPPQVTLDAFVGAPPAIPNAKSRFSVSTGDPANPTERLTVVTDGRVGVNEPDPTHTLQVTGSTGIRHASGYLSADQETVALAFNAYKPAGGPWINPDVAHNAAAVEIGETGGVPGLIVQTSGSVDPPVWKVHVAVKGDTGHVGVGTAAPLSRLHVAGTGHLNAILDLTDVSEHLTLVVGTAGSGLRFSDTNEFFIASQAYGAKGDTTFGNEHLRIRPNGNVGIGTTNPQAKLHVNGPLRVVGSASKTTGIFWTAISDRRLKKDIAPVEDPLAKVLGLRGKTFVWRDPESIGAGSGHYVGFIAQDVEKVFPEWVETTPEGTKAINPVGLEALLVEALRELAERTKRLEKEVAALRAEHEHAPPKPKRVRKKTEQ